MLILSVVFDYMNDNNELFVCFSVEEFRTIASCTRSIMIGTRRIFRNFIVPFSFSLWKIVYGELQKELDFLWMMLWDAEEEVLLGLCSDIIIGSQVFAFQMQASGSRYFTPYMKMHTTIFRTQISRIHSHPSEWNHRSPRLSAAHNLIPHNNIQKSQNDFRLKMSATHTLSSLMPSPVPPFTVADDAQTFA